jgi:proline dehydrogenase
VRTLDVLLDGGAYVGIATHDEYLVERGLEAVRKRGLGPHEYELQMLLGVRPELGDRIVAGGHRLRIYVPFGRHWYEYSLRRLQENPKIAGYVAGDVGRRLIGRG